jgi:MFS family permease
MRFLPEQAMNPYIPEHYSAMNLELSPRSPKVPLIFIVAIFGGAICNVFFQAYPMPFDDSGVPEGIFAGEHIVLATWFASGCDSTRRRFTQVAWTGLLWMSAAWVGFGMKSPEYILAYMSEYFQFFTVCPISLAISAAPMLSIRRLSHWQFHGSYERPSDDSSFDTFTIAIFAVAIGCSYFVNYRYGVALSNITTGFAIGLVLGIYSLLMIPLFAIGFLQARLVRWLLIPILGITCLIAFLISTFIAIPGAGGGTAPIFGFALASTNATLVPLFIAFSLWRRASLRLRRIPPG